MKFNSALCEHNILSKFRVYTCMLDRVKSIVLANKRLTNNKCYGVFILKWFFRDNKTIFYLFVFNKIVCFGICQIDVLGYLALVVPLLYIFYLLWQIVYMETMKNVVCVSIRCAAKIRLHTLRRVKINKYAILKGGSLLPIIALFFVCIYSQIAQI